MRNAIYYRGMYLLLPEEYPTYAKFMEDLESRELPTTYDMVVLREDHKIPSHIVQKGLSMAPYFLSGYHDDPCTVVISKKEDVYPTQVEILDQATYNARLRQLIEQNCQGCQKFKPLSDRTQSLNGHFEEMALDGVCLFRQETKPALRSFHNHLFSFGGFFKRSHWENQTSEAMLQNLASWFYVRYDKAILEEADGRKTLSLTCKKKELLSPVVTNAIEVYMRKITTVTYKNQAPAGTYAIRLESPYVCTEECLEEILSQEKQEMFRKECKKLGVALAVLEYDPAADEKVRAPLTTLIDNFYLFPLLCQSGRDFYLVAETSYVLKQLRYHSPLLRTYHSYISLYDQYRSVRYRIDFPMEPLG